MAKGLGNNYMLWVESSTPGTYNVIKGQQGGSLSRNAASIDLSTKDNSGYGAGAPGLRSWSLPLTIIPDLPDATGYTRLETLCNAGVVAPFNVQIRKNGLSGVSADAVFAGSCYGNIDSTDYAQNSGVSVKITLTGNGAPTTDTYAV